MTTHHVFCLQCGSNCCEHLQKSRATLLTPRELSILRGLIDPKIILMKDLAYSLHLSHATLKVYISRIYRKIGWTGGTLRLLTLWVLARRESLGVEIPTLDQFPEYKVA